MGTLYLETSAVLAWLFDQSRADEVRAAVDAAEQIVTSSLTLAETERALVRAENQKTLRAGDAQKLRGILQRAQTSWLRMSVSDYVLTRASMPYPVEPIRTLDAIHLATALTFTKGLPDLQVLSLDRRIQQNAEAMGIG